MNLTVIRPVLFFIAALIVSVDCAFAQLAPPGAPAENPVTEEKRVLGKILFWDEQLSSDDTVACGTCHIPAAGGSDPRLGSHPGPDGQFDTDDDTIGSPGIVALDDQRRKISDPLFGDGLQVTPKASPGIFMSMYAGDIFWDGRARDQFTDPQNPGAVVVASGGGLESQAVGPILNNVEMAHQGRQWTDVVVKLQNSAPLALAARIPADVSAVLGSGPSYPDLFADAFGDPTITPPRIALAIAAYERTLVPDQAPWDRFMRGEQGAMTAEQVAGWTSFEADTVCDNCHVPPQFTDHEFYNIGLRPASEDAGRQNVTLSGDDLGSFKTPSLRNVGLRKALTHVGWVTDTQDAANFYNASAENNGHTQFTDFQSMAPAPNGGPSVAYALVTFLAGDPVAQAPVLDFLTNALTDPRAATESFPFDRPLLTSEMVAVLSYNLTADDWTPQRADLVAGIISSAAADVVALQETTPAMLNDLAGRLGGDYEAVSFTGGSPDESLLLRAGKFNVLDTGSASAALSCNGHEQVDYAVLEYLSSAERIVLYNNVLCPPGDAFPAGEAAGQQRNELNSVLLVETMLANQAAWGAPGIAVGEFNATDVSGTMKFLLGGQPLSRADVNPVALDDALELVNPGSADLASTQRALVNRSTTGMLVLDAIVVANADTAMAADNEPLLISVAVDTTPQGVQPAPGDSSDRSAPSAPGNLAVMASTETTIDLSWTAATDNTGVSRYRLYRGSKLLATTGGTTYADSDLQSATTYAYSVTAVDDAGNESAAAQLNATTAGNTGPVTPPPATSSGGGSTDMMSLILLLAGWQRRRITRSRRSERPRHTA